MTSTKPRPNFNIMERKPTTVKYEDFKRDFLNPNITAKKVKRMHDLTKGEYEEYRGRVLDETGLSRKPAYYGKNTRLSDEAFIRKQYDGFYIYKTTNSFERYYGKYNDLETAKLVRDKLVECNWDENEAVKLREEYSAKRRRPSYDKAVEIYPEFEKHYFAKELTIKEIKELMDISDREYLYLVKMIKENHGRTYRRK